MNYGMTYEQYWYGEPKMARYYREAYKVRLNERNEEMWRQGIYFLDALNVALHNNINLSGKSIKALQYMNEPLRLFPLTEEEKEIKTEEELNKAEEQLKLFKSAMGAKYGNRNIEP